MKKILSLGLALLLIIIGGISALAEDGSNVLDGCSAWAKEEIVSAIELGFVPQELQSDYKKTITRQEFAKIAIYFSAMQYNCDVEDYYTLYCKYYKKVDPAYIEYNAFDDCSDYFVVQARETDMVSGIGNNFFHPNRDITRQESAVMLENA